VKTNRLIFLLGTALLAAGCKREEGIRAYNAPKDPPQPGKIQWTVPDAWKQLPPGQMVHAAYQISEVPSIKLTVSEVTSMGSGVVTVSPNVKRWAGQLGLPQPSEAELDKMVTTIQVDGRESYLIDLIGPNPAPDGGPQQRMLGALVPDGSKVWAFKMSGPAEAIAAQKPAFEGVVQSVHFGSPGKTEPAASEPAAPAPPPPPANESIKIPGIASYVLPTGWQIDPRPRPMREATIVVRAGNTAGEIVVSRLGPNSLSDLMGNLNRWRGQVRLPPTQDAAAHPAQPIAFAQGPGSLRDFEGAASEGANRQRQLVAYTQFPGAPDMWFFRFVGPYDLVTQNKPAFEGFVKNLKFDK
jgi:hypothetical protein